MPARHEEIMRILLAALVLLFAPAVAHADCPALPGVQPVLAERHDYVLVGEAHGTVELPAVFADLVCQAAADGRPLLVGVEHAPENQIALDAFLASDGGAAAQETLLTAPAWNEAGSRGSQAMLDLIERVRRIKADGVNVRVIAFDHVIETAGTSELREQNMAGNLTSALAEAPGARVLVLTGLGHADKEGFVSMSPPFRSMAQFLPAERTLSLAFSRTGGEALSCRGVPGALTCAVAALTARDAPVGRGVALGTERGGFDGVISTGGVLTASAAARSRP